MKRAGSWPRVESEHALPIKTILTADRYGSDPSEETIFIALQINIRRRFPDLGIAVSVGVKFHVPFYQPMIDDEATLRFVILRQLLLIP